MERRRKKTAGSPLRDRHPAPLRKLVQSLDRTRERLDVVLDQLRGSTPPSSTRNGPRRSSGVYGRRVRVLVVGERTQPRHDRIVELMAEGLDVIWAMDLVQAAARCAVDEPDVIVLDRPRICVQQAALDRLSGCSAHVVMVSPHPVSPDIRHRCAVVIREPCDAIEIAAVVRGLSGTGAR